MHVFIDESEWPRPKDPDGFTVWGAIALHPSKGRDFFRALFNLEKKFWKVTEPYEFEIKGRLLLSRPGMTSPKKQEFCEEVISLCKLNGVQAFAVGLKNAQPSLFDQATEPIVYRAYSRLLERIDAMMSQDHPNDMATVALDSQDERTDTRRALAFGNFLHGNTTGRTLTHIADSPFFVSSKATVGIQIADLLAYALAQQNQGRQDIRPICDRLRELEWWSSDPGVDFPRRGFRFEDLQRNPDSVKSGLGGEGIGSGLEPIEDSASDSQRR